MGSRTLEQRYVLMVEFTTTLTVETIPYIMTTVRADKANGDTATIAKQCHGRGKEMDYAPMAGDTTLSTASIIILYLTRTTQQDNTTGDIAASVKDSHG